MSSPRNIHAARDNFNYPDGDKLGRPNFLADTAGPAEPAAPATIPAPPPQPPEPWQQVGTAARRALLRLRPMRDDYSPGDLELYAQHVADRARFRPPACNSGESCWVERGPPAISTASYCLGCGAYLVNLRGQPRARLPKL